MSLTADVLHYHQPAQQWTQALPVGNGRLGAMVFGGVGTERLALNEDTLWTGGPYDPVNPHAAEALPRVRELLADGHYVQAADLVDAQVLATPVRQAAYSTVGDLLLDFGTDESGTNYRRQLDLRQAMARTDVTIDGTHHTRRVVAAPEDDVIAVHLATTGGPLRVRARWRSPLSETVVSTDGTHLILSGRNDPHADHPGALTFQARLHLATDGALRIDGDEAVITAAHEATLLIAIATSYRSPTDVSGDPAGRTKATIDAVAGRTFDEIAARTQASHRELFDRLDLDLGSGPDLPTDERIAAAETTNDPALAALYLAYARYLLICSSRPGSQPANLQGIWNESTDPPWGSKYTVNINTQMNYWPALMAALPECTEPLDRLIREVAVTGAGTADQMYGARGWVCHHNTDLWRATAPIDGARFGMWPTGGAWLVLHLWQRYQFDPDAAYLASIYPLMLGAAQFFLDTLVVDGDTGWLVTSPSVSPENAHPFGTAVVAGPTMDCQILRDLFDATAQAAALVGDDGAIADLQRAREQLPPNQIGSHGQLQEWLQDWDAQAPEQQHRHVSHLYGLYPSRQIDVERTPELAAAAARSLDDRGDLSTGWAIAWRIALWARLRDGDRAHAILGALLGTERTYPNLFDAHPPFQIDGNFGGAAAILEMLVQHDGEAIDLLPALPSAWPHGRLRGVQTPGPCTLDASWADGELTRVGILASRSCVREVRWGGRRVRLSLAAGQSVELTAADFGVSG